MTIESASMYNIYFTTRVIAALKSKGSSSVVTRVFFRASKATVSGSNGYTRHCGTEKEKMRKQMCQLMQQLKFKK